MAVHEPQIGPPPPSRDQPQRALPASGVAEGLFGVPGSELSALVAAGNWAAGPLGDPQEWPQSLRTAVGICLSSRFPILLWWGPELVMIYNDAYRPMLGQSKHPRALGAPGREVWGEIWDVIGPMLEQVMAGGGATWSADERLVVDRNGYLEECFFTFSYSPITDESGGVGGVFCAVTETTERVLGERRLTTLAEMVALVGVRRRADVLTRAGNILRENAADHPVVAVLDAPPEGDRLALNDLVEKQLLGLGAGTRARVADLVRQVSGTGRRATVAADHEGVAAGIRAWHAYPVAVSAGPARGRGAAVIVLGESVHRRWDASLDAYATLGATHVAAVLADVSRLADERQRRRALVELDAAKSAFFTNLSHELRTPLTLIAGPVHEALGAAEHPHQRELLELVERNTHRLVRMVDAMLDFGRIEAGGLAPRLQVVDVSALAAGLAETFRPALERAGLAFYHDCGTGIEASLDPDMVDRIVLNLLANAMKYTPAGSVGLRVRPADDVVEISVTDTGVGIHPDDVDRAFARFERLPAPPGARSHEGAGIGLAMVQQLTELMGGEVAVTSEVGHGSTFTVRLPAGPATVAPGADEPGVSSTMTPRRVDDFLREVQSWHQPSSPTRLGDPRGVGAWPADRPRVVVAEDNPDLRSYLAQVLGDDYDVELVPDGQAALDAVRRDAPDLVLTDVMMPELDGYGLVDAIRQDPALAGIPVVLLSARAGEHETSSALGAGADDYLVKPFSVLELRARVASNLERAAARSQDAAWRRAVTDGLHDALLVLDLDGTVLEVNDRFTSLLGWDAADAPVARPYPWDATADGLAAAGLADAVDLAIASADATGALEVALRHRDGRRVMGSVRVSTVQGGRGRPTRLLATVRDVTAEHEARQRRATAAALSAELGSADELTDVVAAAVAGLSVLFGGDATVRVVVGRSEQLFTASGPVTGADLDPRVADRLDGAGGEHAGPAVADGVADGILLSPGGDAPRCRVWVSFPAPRPVTADERIAGDLLVQGLALACDRVVAATGFAEREQHLRRAVESHEKIGQAVGILVERHRWTPTVAFERLKRTSQDHNTKLREVALRVIESGADPGDLES